MLTTTVQLNGAADYELQMVMDTSTSNTDISLSREFQFFSDPTRAHSLLEYGKGIKSSSKRKWNEHEYHFQDRKYLSHISIKISCATTQFPEFSFCGPHAKPHGVRRLSEHEVLHADCKMKILGTELLHMIF